MEDVIHLLFLASQLHQVWYRCRVPCLYSKRPNINENIPHRPGDFPPRSYSLVSKIRCRGRERGGGRGREREGGERERERNQMTVDWKSSVVKSKTKNGISSLVCVRLHANLTSRVRHSGLSSIGASRNASRLQFLPRAFQYTATIVYNGSLNYGQKFPCVLDWKLSQNCVCVCVCVCMCVCVRACVPACVRPCVFKNGSVTL